MSADRNIVGNVGEDETSLRVRHQPRQQVGVAGVAADNPMSAERENVTRPGDRLERGVRLERAVLGDFGLLINNDLVDLDLGELRDHHRHVLEDEFIQLDLQRAEIPASLFAEAIESNPKKAPLGRRQMARHDTGQAPQAYPSVPARPSASCPRKFVVAWVDAAPVAASIIVSLSIL